MAVRRCTEDVLRAMFGGEGEAVGCSRRGTENADFSTKASLVGANSKQPLCSTNTGCLIKHGNFRTDTCWWSGIETRSAGGGCGWLAVKASREQSAELNSGQSDVSVVQEKMSESLAFSCPSPRQAGERPILFHPSLDY